jgi:hypothetical protein
MPNPLAPSTLAERKAQILQEGALYRQGMVAAKVTLVTGLSTRLLVHSALEHLIRFVAPRLTRLGQPVAASPADGQTDTRALLIPLVNALLPPALSACAALKRKKWLKPALGVGLLVGVAALILVRRRRV